MKTIILILAICLQLSAQSEFLLLMNSETAFVDTLGTEMLVNGDMELNSNWTAFGQEGADVSERSTTQVHGGTYSWHINVDAATEGMSSDDFNIEAGKTYWVTFWYYIVSGGFSIAPYNGYYGGTNNNSLPTGEWTYNQYKLTGTSTGADKLLTYSTGGAGAEYYLDDISVKELLP